jgi:RNA polymerase sigma factor (sigma-70 family)
MSIINPDAQPSPEASASGSLRRDESARQAEARDRADMERLAAGHDPALNDLMERHAAPVFHFLCRMLDNEEDANDLAQETFVRVYRARGSFRAGGKFSTWLYTIAANLARNHIRWRSRHPGVSLDSESEVTNRSLADILPAKEGTPGDHLSATERTAAVREAVHALPADLREAVVLCEWEDRTVAEAAAILETTPKAVESRLYRARRLLRKRLAGWL